MKKTALLCLIILPLLWCFQSRKSTPVKGVTEITLEHNGISRSCLLYTPSCNFQKSLPLLLVLHGAGGTPGGLIKLTRYRFNELADEKGFYVAYPEGIRRLWHDARNDKSSYVHRNKVDDVGFIHALIEKLAAHYPIDSNRIFASGISNGGFMCFRLACELSQEIRGIAAIAATLPRGQKNSCLPERPIPVIIFNGTNDTIVPYEGGSVRFVGQNRGQILSSEETARIWAHINECSSIPITTVLPDSDPGDHTRVQRIAYQSCNSKAEVHLYRIESGGHTWPGGVQYLYPVFIGYTSRDINACDIIWDFFRSIN